jgi:hypothetical protein
MRHISLVFLRHIDNQFPSRRAPSYFCSDPRPSVTRHLERDSLYRIPQILNAFGRLSLVIETVEPSSAYSHQLAHPLNRQRVAAHFLPDLSCRDP